MALKTSTFMLLKPNFSNAQKSNLYNLSNPIFHFLLLRSKSSSVVVEEGLKKIVKKKKLGVFVSGGGSNFRPINQAILDGDVNGELVVLVTNKPDCGGALYAKENSIPVVMFPKVKDSSIGVSAEDLVASLR
ncbi:hypothetical protein LIER_30740 [Lithospermum erythrorhizon]|uniref:phosphoribosylglycinamide formyltransferase 1 n=1 Tax=Lithospermum erythrorhizon TaxID=34254 RepID=A0AAV3RNP8_LITER